MIGTYQCRQCGETKSDSEFEIRESKRRGNFNRVGESVAHLTPKAPLLSIVCQDCQRANKAKFT